MTELVFIEGISGVGKSTMVSRIAKDLKQQGYEIKAYLESDFANPIDFYSTAWLTDAEYETLCFKHASERSAIRRYTIRVKNGKLIRYYNQEEPLFQEPLLSELKEKEFCYKPEHLVPFAEYTSIYESVWELFAAGIDETYDFILFDGSLLHHPMNDMMRNYHVAGEQAVSYIVTLLNALGNRKRYIFYLKTGDVASQLKKAHANRKQHVPTEEEIDFWEKRQENDRIVLEKLNENMVIFDVSDNGWEQARKRMEKLIGDQSNRVGNEMIEKRK